ncbi:hypothetical protein CEXT_546451 [Caerostris extrusa]|uniref:Uncharacterized protein n=1 Tax=Caerostris extrusa TaxID=172846 RepID=A0AAV4N0X8_CAEEX|nr:hypothetical protein CEXT_546451 [Caerostris extrusa]
MALLTVADAFLEDGLQRLKIIVIPPRLSCESQMGGCHHELYDQGTGSILHIYGPLARPRLLDLAEGVMLIHVHCPRAMRQSHEQRSVWNLEDTYTFMLHQGIYLNNTEVYTVLAALPPILLVKPKWRVHLVTNFVCLTEIYCNYSMTIPLSDVIPPDVSLKYSKMCIVKFYCN